MQKKHIFVLLFLMFLVSIIIRLPQINRALSCQHEWVTAQTLIAIENLQKQGATKHLFSILQTYPNQGDKYVINEGISTLSSEGFGYYISFPPLAVIFPYIVFLSLGLEISVLGLQIFNLCLHFSSSFFIYLILNKILGKKDKASSSVFWAVLFFISLPSPMWYFSNVYSWDTFWIHLWIPSIYFVILAFDKIEKNKFNPWMGAGLFILNFALIYADYTGIFFSIIIGFIALMRIKNRNYFWLIPIYALSSMTALVINFLQYSEVVGFHNFIETFLNRGRLRSDYSKTDFFRIALYYGISYITIIIPLIVSYLIKVRKKIKWNFSRNEKTVMLLSFLPVMIHHVILPNWTSIHNYSVLKSSVFFVIVLGIFLKRQHLNDRWLYFLSSMCMVSVLIFALYFSKCQIGNEYRDIAISMKKYINRDETIFVQNDYAIHPQFIYYLKRNVKSVEKLEEAELWLKDHEKSQGIFFKIKQRFQPIQFEVVKIQIDDDKQ